MALNRMRLLQMRNHPQEPLTPEEQVEVLDLALLGLALRQYVEKARGSARPASIEKLFEQALDDLSRW